MPPELVRARAWGTRLRPTTSPTSVSETERERIHLSFMVCQPSRDDEKYDALEGACQGGRSQDCRQRAAVEPIGTGRSPASEGWQRARGWLSLFSCQARQDRLGLRFTTVSLNMDWCRECACTVER